MDDQQFLDDRQRAGVRNSLADNARLEPGGRTPRLWCNARKPSRFTVKQSHLTETAGLLYVGLLLVPTFPNRSVARRFVGGGGFVANRGSLSRVVITLMTISRTSKRLIGLLRTNRWPILSSKLAYQTSSRHMGPSDQHNAGIPELGKRLQIPYASARIPCPGKLVRHLASS